MWEVNLTPFLNYPVSQFSMRLSLDVGASLLLFLAASATFACGKQSVAPLTDVSISNCGEVRTVRVFLHTSRHGIWASNDPGLNGKGFVITLADAEPNDAGVARLLKYSRDPRESDSKSFQATLTGKVVCPAGGKAVRMAVRKITNVQLFAIRDAE